MYQWSGLIPASKSFLNRVLILKSHEPAIEIQGYSACDDVVLMEKALTDFAQEKTELNCGNAAAVLRFLSFRVSRKPGNYLLKGSNQLLKRPYEDLIYILSQLNVDASMTNEGFRIQSQGWRLSSSTLSIPRSTSSQFASGLILNAWSLSEDLHFQMLGTSVSDGYWLMSKKIAEDFGMSIEDIGKQGLRIKAGQKIKNKTYPIELDMSSAFAIAAAGALCGQIEIKNFLRNSLQPDCIFTSLLLRMGAQIKISDETLVVKKEKLSGIKASLVDAPDLFPVLSVLCAFAEGASQLRGAPHLAHKESNRLQLVASLLEKMEVEYELLDDGISIIGNGIDYSPPAFSFNPHHDHRMAMAAGLLKLKGIAVEIENLDCVNKSFPEFWQILGI